MLTKAFPKLENIHATPILMPGMPGPPELISRLEIWRPIIALLFLYRPYSPQYNYVNRLK